MFDINNFKKRSETNVRYRRQLERITAKNGYTQNIERAVEGAVQNIKDKCRSFVIYGEPQSGKTEMMITLTSRLLDEGFKIVVILLNDSVQLLSQNLERIPKIRNRPSTKKLQ